MDNKWARKYYIIIETNNLNLPDNVNVIKLGLQQYVLIELPLTIEFSINRGLQANINFLNLNIYNLSEEIRNNIFQDRYPKFWGLDAYKKVIFVAGYEDDVNVLFMGNVYMCTSKREMGNIITNLQCLDGGFDIGGIYSSHTLAPKTTKQEAIEKLISDFEHIERGQVSLFPGIFERGTVLDGNTMLLLRKLTSNSVFVDLEKIHCLRYNEYVIPKPLTILNKMYPNKFPIIEYLNIPVINADTGLLQIPQRRDTTIVIDTIFNPSIGLGQMIEIVSLYQTQYNGIYKVVGIKHNGTISASICGNLKSTFEILIPGQLKGGLNE